MTRTWQFTDLEFVVLWEDSGQDMLPPPFVFASRTPLWDDYLRERRQTRDRLADTVDDSLRDILEMLAQSDIRIEVGGWDPREPVDPKAVVRLVAVRRDNRAVLATELPGETVLHSGGFTVTECNVLSMAEAVVAALPAAEPGRRREVVLADLETADDDMDYSYGRSSVLDPADDSPREQAEAFLRAPVTFIGLISIVQGRSRFGSRGITRRELAWRDLDGDGRYALTAGNPPVARAVDSAMFAELISAEIAAVVQVIKDERYGTHSM